MRSHTSSDVRDPVLRGVLGERPPWRLGLVAVLALAALLETWALTVSGYANGYYAEGALAAGGSWTSLLTNAADPSGIVSLDKGPLPDWIMGLCARVFGVHPLSVLLPNALYAVAAVAILHQAVRLALGRRVALLAALMLALSPVSVLMGRYDDPDALLALLLVASAWALLHALQSGRLRDLLLCGALVGLAFNTKMLEAYVIVPGLAAAFLLAAAGPLRRRIARLLAGGAVMVGVSVAWYGAMTLTPAGDRPYVTDTTDDSWFSLIFNANGLDHITGATRRQGAGLLRLFSGGAVAGQAAWLIPLALLGLLVGLWLCRRSPRADGRRAALVLFGLWLLAGFIVFSFSHGIFHSYYTSAIAPAIAALAAAALVYVAERLRTSTPAAAVLAAALMGTGALSFTILDDTPSFVPWLRWVVLLGGAVSALAVALAPMYGSSLRRPLPMVLAGAGAALAVLGGPVAYSIATVGFGRSGSSPTAGPAILTPPRNRTAPLTGGAYAPALVTYLERHRDGARYLVAATGSDFASPIGLATRAPVVTLGGFNGADPAPTVPALASLVRTGELRYVLLTRLGGSPAAVRRRRWIVSHCAPVGVSGRVRGLLGENGAVLDGAGEGRAGILLGLYGCGAAELAGRRPPAFTSTK